MKKSLAIAIFTLMAALVLGVGAYAWSLDGRLTDAGRAGSAYGGDALGEFTKAVTDLDDTLSEAQYATDTAMLGTLCSKAAANAAGAVTALSSLPYSTQELEKLAQYLNGTGDYALYLAGQAAEGRMLGATELENLTALSEAMGTIAAQAGGIMAALDSGDLTLDKYAATGDDGMTGTVGHELAALDAALDDFPELDYDGRYSANTLKPDASYLDGKTPVNENDARRIAAEFLGVDADTLTSSGLSEGVYSVYGFDTGDRYISVTQLGGVVAAVHGECSPGGAQTSTEDVEALALEKLEAVFGGEFTALSTGEQRGLYTFVFVPVTEDGVALLPDTVAVTVESATGELCSWNADGYIMYHTARDLTPELDGETAAAAVPDTLSILGSRLALVRSDDGVETICWEFACENASGGGVNVFVDAKTGLQAKIELTN